MNNANERQVGGAHYKSDIQHWDFVYANDLDYFQGQITLYITRWKKKGGLQDLEKAKHFLEKYIELETAKLRPTEITRKMLPPKVEKLDPTGQKKPFGYDSDSEI